jgi:hypothetical protein
LIPSITKVADCSSIVPSRISTVFLLDQMNDGWQYLLDGVGANAIGSTEGGAEIFGTKRSDSHQTYLDGVAAAVAAIADEAGPTYTAPFDRDWGCFSEAFTPGHASQLNDDGYTVIDGVFGAVWAGAFRTELEWLTQHKVLRPNETEFTTAVNNAVGILPLAAAAAAAAAAAHSRPTTPLRHTKPHIHELDLHHAAARRLVPEFNALFDRFTAATADLPRALTKHLPNLQLDTGLFVSPCLCFFT